MKGICKKILSVVLVLTMVVQLFATLGNVAQAGDATGVTISGIAVNSGTTAVDSGTQYNIYLKTDYSNTGATWGGWDNSAQVIVNGQAKTIDGACWASDVLLYVQITLPTATPLESVQIDAGTLFTINSVALEIKNTYTVYYYDGGYHDTAKVETTPVTISGIDYSRTVLDTTNNWYGIYLTTNYTNTGATWGGWDNTTNVSVDGVNKRADTCWANTGANSLLYIQVAVDAGITSGSVKIEAGKQFTINGEIIEIQNEYIVYYYDGGFHDTAKVEGTPVTIAGIDYTRTVFANNMYQIYLTTNYTNAGATWGGWDNTTNVCVDGVDKRVDTCWANTGENSLLYVQVTVDAGTTAESIKIDAGKQFTINGEIIEIQNEYTVYYYDGGFHDTAKVEETPVTIAGIDYTRTVFANNMYQIYLTTNYTNAGATWGGWDNTTNVCVDGVDQRADTCWANTGENSLLYVQVTVDAGTTAESIKIDAGKQFTINGEIIEIQNEYTVYYYDGGFHDTEKVTGTPVTIAGIDYTRTVFTNNMYQIYLTTNYTNAGATWGGWDNTTNVCVDGVDKRADTCWANTGENSLLYVQVTVDAGTTAESIKIDSGKQFTINGEIIEIQNEYTIYFKNDIFADTPLYTITKTIGDTTVVETVSGDYTLPEISVDGYTTLGWDVDGELHKVGTTLSTKTEGYTIEAVYVAFSQIDGAQVRLTTANENEKIGGIRFVCKLGSDSKSEHIVQMGILIMPTNYMTNGELTHANYGLTNAQGTTQGYREFVLDNAEMQLEAYAQDTAANGVEAYYLKGSIVNLYDYNYTRSYSARSFLKVQYADGAEYIYTDYSKDNNTRRICDVAKKMIETYPEKYAPIQNKTYPIVYEYAKVADTMESFAFFGPEVVITNNAYDATATKTAMQEYAATGFKYLWLDSVNYHYHDRYSASSVESEQWIYDNPSHPSFDLKQTMQLAKECGLEVIVLDWALRQLSVSDIALVNADAASRQALGLWLQTGDAETVELIGSAIDESKFSADFSTYTYDGASVTGYESGQARVLNYVYQFESEEALQEWVAIKMSAYAKEDNFRGVMLADEPTEAMFAQLAMVTKVIKNLYPNAYVQNSNLPCYGYQSGSGTIIDEYDDGYDTWSAADGPWKKLLQAHANVQSNVTETGINFYPFARWYHSWGSYYSYELRDHYLSSLQFLATTTRDADINLEFTIQSYAVEKLYAEITKAKLDLQANLALAFGTKTLGYFRYNTTDDGIEPGSDNWSITQTINSDSTLKDATLYQNKNGNYLKSNMTFFEYQASQVFGTGTYVSTDSLTQATELKKNIITVPSGATVLVNEFYNEYTDQYGYYVVNLATLNDEDGNNTSNDAITITLSTECQVYQDYKSYNTEKANKVSTVTLEDGQGAFIVVE